MIKCIVVIGIGVIFVIGGIVFENWMNLLVGVFGICIFEYDWVEQFEFFVMFVVEVVVCLEEVFLCYEVKCFDLFLQFVLIVVCEVWVDVGLFEVVFECFGVDFVMGIGGLWIFFDVWDILCEKGLCCVMLFMVLMFMLNVVVGNLLLQFEVCVYVQIVVSVCVFSMEFIIYVFYYFQEGFVDVVIVGGIEFVIYLIMMVLFVFVQVLLCCNDDLVYVLCFGVIDCDGFVMGEGVVVFIFEIEEYVQVCGVKIYGYVLGGGVIVDVYYIMGNDFEGKGVV